MHITALIDQSIYRKSVIDHAAWVAATADATVELLHVVARNEYLVDRMPAHPTGAIIFSDSMTIDDEIAKLREHGEVLLAEGESALRSKGISKVRIRCEEGNVDDIALKASGASDLLVMGKRGEHADLARLPLGANVQTIVQKSDVPVLVVSRAFRPVHRALVAFDLDDACAAAIGILAESRMFPPIAVVLLHVGDETDEMRRALAQAANRLEQAGYDATVEIASGIAHRVIAERAVTDAADLVVMGTYGQSRLKSLLFGNLTNEVIRGTQTPVLLVNQDARGSVLDERSLATASIERVKDGRVSLALGGQWSRGCPWRVPALDAYQLGTGATAHSLCSTGWRRRRRYYPRGDDLHRGGDLSNERVVSAVLVIRFFNARAVISHLGRNTRVELATMIG